MQSNHMTLINDNSKHRKSTVGEILALALMIFCVSSMIFVVYSDFDENPLEAETTLIPIHYFDPLRKEGAYQYVIRLPYNDSDVFKVYNIEVQVSKEVLKSYDTAIQPTYVLSPYSLSYTRDQFEKNNKMHESLSVDQYLNTLAAKQSRFINKTISSNEHYFVGDFFEKLEESTRFSLVQRPHSCYALSLYLIPSESFNYSLHSSDFSVKLIETE